jgi:antitoxin VapB
MALHISNPKANRLARKLARKTGESLTDAVIRSLEERLERNDLRGREQRAARKAAILDVVGEFRALPVLDGRSADELLGYDENGLPR